MQKFSMKIMTNTRLKLYRTKRTLYKIFRKYYYRTGSSKRCVICSNTFRKFLPLEMYRSHFTSALEVIGSDVENFNCPFCGAIDRTRHLFLYFENLNLWRKMVNSRILHLAAEEELSKRIHRLNVKEYIKGDLKPMTSDTVKVDITAIQYSNNYFDIIICNHVLEHVLEYEKAIKEIFRVLKKGGIAIVQTPFSKKIKNHFSDPYIKSNEDKALYYGTSDHVRVFGSELFNNFTEAGFDLNVQTHDNILSDYDPTEYGVNVREDLILLEKN